jgi:hypothetical protein
MGTLADFRAKYPGAYDDMSDSELAARLHSKFYSDMPREEFNKKIGYKPAPMTPQSDWSAAITDIPSEIGKAFMSGAEHTFAPRGTDQGFISGPVSTLARVGGPVEMAISPLTGLGRSIGGHLMANIERATGENIINPILSHYGYKPQHPDPEKMYEQAKSDVEKASMALGPGRGGVPPGGGISIATSGKYLPRVEADIAQTAAAREAAKAAAAKPQPVVEAINQLGQSGIDVNIPRAEASESRLAQQIGQWGSKAPIIGSPVAKAVEAVPGELEKAKATVAGQIGIGEGKDIAGKIGQDLATAAETETQAREAAQTAAHQAELDRVENTRRARQAEIDRNEQQAESAARSRFGDVNPQDAGADLLERTQQHHNELTARKNAAYQQAANEPGMVATSAVRAAPNDIRTALRAEGREPDPVTMSASNSMLNELDRLSNVPQNAVGVNLQDLEAARKRLNFLSRSASNNADRSAASMIMRTFDEWQEMAMRNNFVGGSPQALDRFTNARRLNTELMNNFGYNQGTDAEKFIHRMVTEDVTPQEVVSKVIGSTPGKQGVSSRLHQQIMTATGNDPIAAQSIRGAYWNTLRQNPETIEPFLTGSGRDMAGRIFSPSDQASARAYANARQQATQERAIVEKTAKDTTPKAPGKIAPGPTQELASRILGAGKTRSDEDLFRHIYGLADKETGDLKTLNNLVQGLSSAARDNLSSSFIRNLGVDSTGKFSTAQFTKDWRNMSSGAKDLLIKDPAHRKNIDAIATIAERHSEVFKKFASPSGLAVTGAGMMAALGAAATNPLIAMKVILGGGAGFAISKVLASPAGASSLSKWAKIAEATSKRPTPAGMAMFHLATRNLANTVSTESGK